MEEGKDAENSQKKAEDKEKDESPAWQKAQNILISPEHQFDKKLKSLLSKHDALKKELDDEDYNQRAVDVEAFGLVEFMLNNVHVYKDVKGICKQLNKGKWYRSRNKH